MNRRAAVAAVSSRTGGGSSSSSSVSKTVSTGSVVGRSESSSGHDSIVGRSTGGSGNDDDDELEGKRRQRRKISGRCRHSRRWVVGGTTVVTLFLLVSMMGLLLRRRWIPTVQQRPPKSKPTTVRLRQNQPISAAISAAAAPKPIVRLSQAVLDMCTRTFWHTLESTTIVLPHGETFVHTGDIDDLWLRDSAAQIHPLLLPLFAPTTTNSEISNNNNNDERVALIYNDARLDRVVAGLIARHALYIRHDPYANAFRIDDSYQFSVEQRHMGRHDLISTWNYELDSGCYTIRMLYYYWKQSKDPEQVIRENPAVEEAVMILVDLWIAEQQHELDAYPTGPLFDCVNCNKPYRYPELPRDGKGSPTNATAGLTWTGFRPSDDATIYGYLVPANMFCAAVLQYVKELAEAWGNMDLHRNADTLQTDIRRGIEQHAIVHHPKYGQIYAYEVDGLGNSLLMDDANVPSLLSIPYLEYPFLDTVVYQNTRRFILSSDNPYFQSGINAQTGSLVSGIGSPHMTARIRTNIWPMAMAMEALTDPNVHRQVELAEQLVTVSAGTGWMHESFDVANPMSFTRPWFCWSDSLYAEMVLRILNTTTDSSSSSSSAQHCPNPNRRYTILEWRDPETVPGGLLAASTAP